MSGKQEQPSKKYFTGQTLPEIINSYPISKKLSQKEVDLEMHHRRSLIDFLGGALDMNPLTRWSPEQARKHPFITNEPFKSPYTPNNLKEPTSPKNRYPRLDNSPKATKVSPRSSLFALSIKDERINNGGPRSADVNRTGNSMDDMRIRIQTHNLEPPSSSSQPHSLPPNSASVYTNYSSQQNMNIPYRQMPVINESRQEPGVYPTSSQSFSEIYAEHPRYGFFGERLRIPSRMPSASTSVDWEPFQDGYDSNQKTPNRQNSINSAISPRSPRSNRNSFFSQERRSSVHLRSTSFGSLNNSSSYEMGNSETPNSQRRRPSISQSYGTAGRMPSNPDLFASRSGFNMNDTDGNMPYSNFPLSPRMNNSAKQQRLPNKRMNSFGSYTDDSSYGKDSVPFLDLGTSSENVNIPIQGNVRSSLTNMHHVQKRVEDVEETADNLCDEDDVFEFNTE